MRQGNIEDLTAELIRLPKRERLEIVRFLLFLDNRSIEAEDIDGVWEEEIAARVRAVDEGLAVGVDYDEAMRRIEQRFFIMKKVFLRQALDEFNDAIEYYEEKQAGLGLRFKDEVVRHVKWILENSLVPRLREGGYRRVNLRVFPYNIAYIVRENTLWILAIAHNHRKPEYWINRKNDISR